MMSFLTQPLSPRSTSSLSFDCDEGVVQPTLSQIRTPASSYRPFVCEEPGCGRRFNRKFTLNEHKKTHTGEKPYVCPLSECSRRFSTSGNLARHKRLHASLKPFECDINGCKRSFPSQEKLDHHTKIHTARKTHMCRVNGCTKTFSTAGNLTRHIKTRHPGLIKTSFTSYPYDQLSPVSRQEPSLQYLPAHQADRTLSVNIIPAGKTKMEFDSIEHPSYHDEMSGFHMTYAFATKISQGTAVASAMEPTVSGCSISVLDEVIEFELTKSKLA
ncbi:FOG: Zn-finger [Plasmopara halstedii]|uniref:Wilms tumor protein homolog n=1 Tax=Plasmopara halstedii TaxID=4781 RepID=A0A0P1AAS5_PLAHL|nr:FOG: Zn-finger [Plasmopara halstedii]CEG37466.1 FOG: Zn-finger [Plasmopara halstedii]|eukprot:XP_024573835.1 FOG: Zn-finger [Plasmopara halstedii]